MINETAQPPSGIINAEDIQLHPVASAPFYGVPDATPADALAALDVLPSGDVVVAEVFERGAFAGYLRADGLRGLLVSDRCAPSVVLELLQASALIYLGDAP